MVVYAAFGGNYSIYPPQNVKMLGKALGSKVYFVTNTGFSIGTHALTQEHSSNMLPLLRLCRNMDGMDTLTASLFLLECW